ncbi:cryptochrome/photolyase family protein, partial [Escherichia coli]|nr:cryptochrome/photolyase family protein [Escherichia coli]
GRFQDAMTAEHESKWSLYHSRLSFSMNSKLLHPKEVIDAALSAYQSNKHIDIAQVEGFIRQILGWREFIRGVYWANMPQYPQKNELEA